MAATNGAKIRNLLGELGLAHRELAERLGVTRARVTQMCSSGISDPELAERVAAELGVSVGELASTPGGASIAVVFTGLPSRWPADGRAAGRLIGRCLKRASAAIRERVELGRDIPASITVSAAAGEWDSAKPDRVGP